MAWHNNNQLAVAPVGYVGPRDANRSPLLLDMLVQGRVAMQEQVLLCPMWRATDESTQWQCWLNDSFLDLWLLAIGVAQANVCNLESGKSFILQSRA